MNLPERIKKHQYEFKMSNGKIVKYTPWLVRDEQEYMYATESITNKEYKIQHIEELLRKCVDDEINFDDFSDLDFLKFAIEVRKVSKGGEHEIIFTCPNCETINEPKMISLEDDVHIKPFLGDTIYINDLSFEIREISRGEIYQMKEIETAAQKKFKFVVHSITSITVDGTIYSNLNVEDVEKYLGEELTSEEFEELTIEVLRNTPSIAIEKKFQCDKCGLETLVFIDNISDFFE